MFTGHDQFVLQLLRERGLVEPLVLAEVAQTAERSGCSLASALVERGGMDRAKLLRAVAEYLGAEYEAEVPETLPGEALAVLDAGLAHRYGVVPLQVSADRVKLLAIDPFPARLVPDLSFALGREVSLVVGDPHKANMLLRRHYGERTGAPGEPVRGLLDLPAAQMALEGRNATELEQLAGEAPIVRYVDRVLTQAIGERASDVHFEPFAADFKVRCRIDGTLHDLTSPPLAFALPVISRVKVLANLNIAEKRVPQDGRLRLRVDGRTVDLRVSTLPTQFGESVVLRVLDQTAVTLDLDQLGLPPAMLAAVRDLIARPSGIFVVTGPTGSGKTTTLYSCLKILNDTATKILTVEDPVEYEIDGVMQVGVNPAAGLDFARSLRAFLRQDPDVVMVGEIRDAETAQIAVQAALTGHLVLATLHTNDAPGAVTRLVDMGVEPYLLAATITGVLAQRLVRRLCPGCRVLSEGAVYRSGGCPACFHTGYHGRFGLFQFMPMTEEIRDLVTTRASHAQLARVAGAQGMTALRAAGEQAVSSGITTAEEIARHI